jgi:phosphonopyruvate decarboxylase
MVGWRGEPGHKDEPQHVHMGRVTIDTLEAIGVPHVVLPMEADAAVAVVGEALERARSESSPVALVVKKGTFEGYKPSKLVSDRYPMTREQAIGALVDALPDNAAVVSTTGKPSRELFEARAARGQPHRDFLTVGGMGHASLIALGAALAQDARQLYCLDGDGAVLMHMGALSTIGTFGPKNFKHVVVNNAAHDSVGGQPTVAFEVDLCAVATACGYRSAVCVSEPDTLKQALVRLRDEPGPAMVEVRVRRGSRADLGRPTMTPQDLKRAIMADLDA